MTLAVAIVIALLPALLGGLWSRHLLGHLQAADFAERLWRHRQRMLHTTVVCVVVVLFTAGWHALWLEPLLVVGALAAGLRLRRAIFEETWSFPAYVVFVVRLYSAFLAFWILLALTPELLRMTISPYRWPVGVLLGLVLVLWSLDFSRVFPRVLGARRLDGADLEPFRAWFEQVDERSPVARPTLHQVPMNGGVFVNAVALPSLRRPAVLFWESLLRLLEPAEVGAIYAHEVAHLEQFHRRRLLRIAAVEWTLVALAVLLPQLLGDRSTPLWYLSAFWPLVVVAALLLRALGSRRRETGADRRALELCGDADVLIRALTRLHLLTRLPRRMALADEERLSHPSLAHRLQAIREAAGQPAEAGSGDRAAAPGSWPRVIATGEAGSVLIFETDRVSWLDGVAAEAANDPEELRRSAASMHTLAYGQLTELRVEPRARGPALAARDVRRRSWVVPLTADTVAEVQQVLDAVDAALAPRARVVGPGVLAKTFLRLAAVFALLMSLFPPMILSLVPPALVSLVRLRPASAGAFGVAGAAAALLRLGAMPEVDPGPEVRWAVSGLLLLLAAAVLVVAVHWARQDPEGRLEWAWPTALIHAGLAGLMVVGMLVAMGWSGMTGPYALHQAAFRLPGLVLLPLAAAAALLFVPRRAARALAALAALVAAGALAVASPAFEHAFVGEPLIVRGAHEEPATRRLEEIARVPLEAGAEELRLSPSGRLYALAGRADGERAYGAADRWQVRRVGGPPLPGGELRAADLRFLDERRILVLIEGDDNEPARWIVELHTFDGADPPAVQAVLDGLEGATLTVQPTAARWWVTGQPAGSDSWGRQILFAGAVGTQGTLPAAWQLPEVEHAGYIEWTPAWGTGALATRWTYPVAEEFGWWPLSAPGGGTRYELWWVEGGAALQLVSSRLDPTCGAVPFGPPAALCVAHYRGQGHLWRLSAPAAGPPTLEPVARLPVGFGAELHWTDGAALVSSYAGGLWRWDRANATLEELVVPDRSGFSTVALAESGVIGTVDWAGGEPLLILYR